MCQRHEEVSNGGNKGDEWATAVLGLAMNAVNLEWKSRIE